MGQWDVEEIPQTGISFDIISKRTRGKLWGFTCWCVYSYPQQSLKKLVVNLPNLVPAWCRSKFLSSSAQAWTCTSSVKMLVLVNVASLSGDSTITLQLRGETTKVVSLQNDYETLTCGVSDLVHVVISVVQLCSRMNRKFSNRCMPWRRGRHDHDVTLGGPRYGDQRVSISEEICPFSNHANISKCYDWYSFLKRQQGLGFHHNVSSSGDFRLCTMTEVRAPFCSFSL